MASETPRIAPLNPPYPPQIQELFDLVVPPGVEPIKLFRTLATNARIFPRFMKAGVLDRGPVAIGDRELVIHRTTARCGCEYEWGVHVSVFARPLGLSEEWIRATVLASPDDPVWDPKQAALVRLCDALHESSNVSDELWQELRGHFDEAQLMELIYTAGLYHAVSFLANALRIELEESGERFPSKKSSDD